MIEDGLAYNESEVITSIESIKKAYENLYNTLSVEIQKSFVDEIANMWACNYAVEFFNNSFKPAFDELLNNINASFENIVASITSAAVAWANTNGNSFSGSGITLKTNRIDVSGIRESINGVRGININTQTIANRLTSITSQAEEELTNVINAVNESGFIGGNMQESLVNSLTQIKNKISEVMNTLNTEIQDYVSKTTAEYQELASSTARAFSGE